MSKTSDGTRLNPLFASAGNTPTFAADLSLTSAYAAEYGNYKTGTTIEKNAFAPWEGLQWFDTTLNTLYVYDGSAWVVVNSDSGWVTPTLTGSWVNFGGGFVAAKYRKLGDEVILRGTVKDGSTGTSNPVFTLPAGSRPLSEHIFLVQANAGHADLRVDTVGRVTVVAYYNSGNNAILALNQIRFSVL